MPVYVAGVSASRRCFAASPISRPSTKSTSSAAPTRLPRVSSLSSAYGSAIVERPAATSARMTVWIASPSTSQLPSRSASEQLAVEVDLAESALDVVEREQRVAEADADVALRARVGEVALQAARHEGRGERVEQRARELEVRLGVLEADRVDLVRHRRRAGRAGLRDLAEVAERDVGPDVGREVVQHAVGVRDARVELGLPVVRLDLGGERVPGEAEATRRTRARRRARRHPGSAATCAAKVPVAPENLPRYSIGLDLRGDALQPVRRRPRAPCRSSSASPAGRGCARASRRRGARAASAASVSMTPRYFGQPHLAHRVAHGERRRRGC